MEHSPLRFLDNDLSIMLCEHVRNSKEELSREFHEKNFNDAIDMNKEYHYELSNIFDNYISKNCKFEWLNLYVDKSISNYTVKQRIKIYEDELKRYDYYTKLRRCYNR